MSDAAERILELCRALGTRARSMDPMRAEHPVSAAACAGIGGDAPLWGGTVGADAARVNGEALWFHDIEPVYGELDEMIRFASAELHERVLADARVQALMPSLHRVRAAYERDKELLQARALAEAEDGAERLRRTIEDESYWALGEELREALGTSRRVLVAGSGPLPITALCIGATLDVHVTCVERDPECHALGKRLISMSGRGEHFESINCDILRMTDFGGYDAIVGVVLLGVGTTGEETGSKSTIARHIAARMRPGTRMVLRDPHGLGKLLYPSLDLGDEPGVRVRRLVPEVGPDHPYRSGLVIAERRASDVGHAY